MRLGSPVFVRLFKETRELEIWLQDAAGDWKFLNGYTIACLSGNLGPKQQEGDMQAPEGFYTVTLSQLNPASRYHLAFNIGYPNAYDLHHQRTGSHIMVHGDEVSTGCYAMTDVLIEEIYLLVSSAIEQGQREVSVHCFPFRFTTERMQQAQNEPWSAFWLNLREGFDAFEKTGKLPQVLLREGRYVFR
ncbi:MAG: murein L,D-transpeptidase family protein [Prosthecobacter sp.]